MQDLGNVNVNSSNSDIMESSNMIDEDDEVGNDPNTLTRQRKGSAGGKE